MITIRVRGRRDDCAAVLLHLTDLVTGLHGVALRRDRDSSTCTLTAIGHLAHHQPPALVAARLSRLIDTGRIHLAHHGRGAHVIDLTDLTDLTDPGPVTPD